MLIATDGYRYQLYLFARKIYFVHSTASLTVQSQLQLSLFMQFEKYCENARACAW